MRTPAHRFPPFDLRIVAADPTGPDIADLLAGHLAEVAAHSPAGSMHALAPETLRECGITFWAARDGATLAGCVALKHLDDAHAETKSLHIAAEYRRRGIASTLLRHLMSQAAERGYRRLSLETGSGDFFQPARLLYTAHGFDYCGPFAHYLPDPNSVFMTRTL